MLDHSLTDLDALAASVDAGWGLPVQSYSDPDWYALERAAIFDRSWYFVGMIQTLPKPGDVILGHAGLVRVIIARGPDGTLRAMANVCRHRGHPVCREAGNHRTLSCPYHGWTYGLDGQLRGAPGSESEADFDKYRFGLTTLSLDTRGPMIFVSADPHALPLTHHFPDFARIAQSRGLTSTPTGMFITAAISALRRPIGSCGTTARWSAFTTPMCTAHPSTTPMRWMLPTMNAGSLIASSVIISRPSRSVRPIGCRSPGTSTCTCSPAFS